jgi:hypothetical protein
MSTRPHMGASQKAPAEPDESLDREFVTRMSERPRPSKSMEWPGDSPIPGFENIRIVIPPEAAYSAARVKAHERMKAETRLPIEEWHTEGMVGVMGDLISKEMLAACCHRDRVIPGSVEKLGVPHYPRLFADSRDVEHALGKQEIGVLFDMFILAEHELGPRLSVLSEDEVDSWIERLKRGLDPLARLSLPDLAMLIRGLIQEVERLRGLLSQDSPESSLPDSSDWLAPGSSATANSSSGEPPEPQQFG